MEKKRPASELIEAHDDMQPPQAKRQCEELIEVYDDMQAKRQCEEMQWPYQIKYEECTENNRTCQFHTGHINSYKLSIEFRVPIKDLKPKKPIKIVTLKDPKVKRSIKIEGYTRKTETPQAFLPMREMFHCQEFVGFKKFFLQQDKQAEPCAKSAVEHVAARADLYGPRLQQQIQALIQKEIGKGDQEKIQSYNPEHQVYFETMQYCKHEAPMVGQATIKQSRFIMPQPQEDKRPSSKVFITIVDENDQAIKTDAYTQMLAVELVFAQKAPMALREMFLPLLQEAEREGIVRQGIVPLRKHYIMDENNHDVVVGDLIPLYEKQKFGCIKWSVDEEKQMMTLEMDARQARPTKKCVPASRVKKI